MKRKTKPRRDYIVQVGPFSRAVKGATSVGNAARLAFRQLVKASPHDLRRDRPLMRQPQTEPDESSTRGWKNVDVVLV